METDFCIEHSFWYYLDPRHWNRKSLVVSFLVFYGIITPVYFALGMRPDASAIEARISASADASDGWDFVIDRLGTRARVVDVKRNGRMLETPEVDVGRYVANENTTLFYGHSVSVFAELDRVVVGDMVTVLGEKYLVTEISTMKKNEIIMDELLRDTGEERIVIMTCAGERVSDDYTERLILEARPAVD